MELVISNIIGLIVGLLTSYTFLRWQLFVKPNVSISPVVIYSTKKCTFRIKIANESKRQVTAIQVKLSILKRTQYDNRAVQLVVRHLPLKSEDAFVLTGRRKHKDPWGLLYARTFETQSDNEAFAMLLSPAGEERRIVLTMEAVDAISGTKVVQKVIYRHEDVVVDAKFGKKFEMIPVGKDSAHAPSMPLFEAEAPGH